MKILKEGKFNQKKLIGTCEKCGCQIEFIEAELSDGEMAIYNKEGNGYKMLGYINCPYKEEGISCDGIIFSDEQVKDVRK